MIKGYEQVVQSLLLCDAKSIYQNTYGQNLLSIACENGNGKIVEMLYHKNPVLLNIACEANYYPIFYGAEAGNFDIVKYLFDQDSNQINKIACEIDKNPVYMSDYLLVKASDEVGLVHKTLKECDNINHQIALTPKKDSALIRCLKKMAYLQHEYYCVEMILI